MYVCMYVYIYIYIYICMYVCIYIYIICNYTLGGTVKSANFHHSVETTTCLNAVNMLAEAAASLAGVAAHEGLER